MSFCLLAIDSASVKKHNRVKSVLKSGEEPSGSVPFFTSTKPKEEPLSPLSGSPTARAGSAHYSRCKMKQAKVCDYEVEDMRCPPEGGGEATGGEWMREFSVSPHAMTSPYVYFAQKHRIFFLFFFSVWRALFRRGMLLAHENVLIAGYSANFGRPLAKQRSLCCLIKARHVWIQLQVMVDQSALGKRSDSFT